MRAAAKSYNIRLVLANQEKIFDELRLHFIHEVMAGEVLEAVCGLIKSQLVGVFNTDAIRASLIDVYGKQLTPKMALEISWRMAGNVPQLKMGKSVPPWQRQIEDEWVPAQIIKAEYTRRKVVNAEKRVVNSQGVWVGFRILAGSSAGMTCHRYWSDKFCAFVSHEFGYSKWRSRPQKWPDNKPFLPFEHATQMYGFRLHLLFTPKSCADNKLAYEQIRITKSMQEYNRSLMTKRTRFLFQCPMQYSHPCHKCPVGRDRCVAACHPKTYKLQNCSGCNQDAYFDPATPATICVSCRIKASGDTQRCP